jgi:hypothetical protein
MGVSREYWFQTRAPAARPVQNRFGYVKSMTATRRGEMRCQRNLAFWRNVCSERSFFVRWGYVSGKKKKTRTVPKPPRAV